MRFRVLPQGAQKIRPALAGGWKALGDRVGSRSYATSDPVCADLPGHHSHHFTFTYSLFRRPFQCVHENHSAADTPLTSGEILDNRGMIEGIWTDCYLSV